MIQFEFIKAEWQREMVFYVQSLNVVSLFLSEFYSLAISHLFEKSPNNYMECENTKEKIENGNVQKE